MADIDRLDPAVESVVSTGDTIGHFPHPNEVIALTSERKVPAIRGNYDQATVGLRQYSGADYANVEAENVTCGRELDEGALTPENRAAIQSWPRDLRLSVTQSAGKRLP